MGQQETTDLIRMTESVFRLRDVVSEFVNSEGIVRAQAASEEREFPKVEAVQTVQSQGAILMEVVNDQTSAVLMALESLMHTIAPWSAGRAALEAAALVTWLDING